MPKFLDLNELGYLMTFQPDKKRPVYNWFYYKEAYSAELVKFYIKRYKIDDSLGDPFVGIGTTALTAKLNKIKSFGVDASPLAVLVSQVKTRNYSNEQLESVIYHLDKLNSLSTNSEPFDWRYELFPPERAIPRRNYLPFLNYYDYIRTIEDKYVHDFLLLGLISTIPQISYIVKDGGVLRINKRKKMAEFRGLFRRKIKKMYREIKEINNIYEEPDIKLGSAKDLRTWNSLGGIITSPPYLNNVDYTKVYGLELSLLDNPKQIRSNMVRSFLDKNRKETSYDFTYEFLTNYITNIPPVVYSYFKDMFKVIDEIYSSLKVGGVGIIVVGNSVMRDLSIETDLIFGEYIEEKYSLESEIHVGNLRQADVQVKGKKPARESSVVFKKEF